MTTYKDFIKEEMTKEDIFKILIAEFIDKETLKIDFKGLLNSPVYYELIDLPIGYEKLTKRNIERMDATKTMLHDIFNSFNNLDLNQRLEIIKKYHKEGLEINFKKTIRYQAYFIMVDAEQENLYD